MMMMFIAAGIAAVVLTVGAISLGGFNDGDRGKPY